MSAVNSSPNRQGRGGDDVCPEPRLKGRYDRLGTVLLTPRPPVERKGQVKIFNMLYTSMKRLTVYQLSLILSVAVLPVSLQAQEVSITEQARVPGRISDGRPAPIKPKVKKPSQDFKINWSQIKYVNGQKFTINEVEPPVIPPKKKPTAADREKSEREFQELMKTLKPSGGTFMIFAEIYNNKTTLLTFNHEGEKYEVWSNLDWNLLCGFANFEGRGRRYGLFLLPSNSSTEGIKGILKKDISLSFLLSQNYPI